jgi:homoserine dehydrogenase
VAASRSQVGVGLMGLGVVGSGVARALLERGESYGHRVGCPLRLVRILEQDPDRERPVRVDRALFTQDVRDIVDNAGIDIVIEVLGGEHPAYEYQRQALEAGKYVVTANKEVIAKHGAELSALALQRGIDILYEASVGGGIPIIAPLKRDLLSNEITAISAIINGTTNYILTSMSREGSDFEPALRRAQELGYAEANPANDIEGMDAVYKLAILASLAFHADIRPEDVYREGITRLSAHDFRYARELGYAIKLLALARQADSQVQVRVHPALLHEEELLAKVDGVLNAVQVEGDLVGRVLFQGQGAGSLPTSSAIVADVLDAARSIVSGSPERPSPPPLQTASLRPMSELSTRYYMRMIVVDSPGVLARIADVLGVHQISIASVIQKEADPKAKTAEIVIMTHEAEEAAVQSALREVEQLPVVVEIGNFLRVEG